MLYDGAALLEPSAVRLGSQSVSSDGSVVLDVSGLLPYGQNQLTWWVDNSQGQKVDGGVYTVKIEATDRFGHVTTWTNTVQVIPAEEAGPIEVYNSAGERVAAVHPPAGLGAIRDFVLLNSSGIAGGQSGEGIVLRVRDEHGNEAVVEFSGRGDRGQLLDSGSYVFKLGGTGQGAQSRSFSAQIMRLEEAALAATLAPNPVGADGWVQVQVPPLDGLPAWARVFNLAGEEVIPAVQAEQAGSVRLDLSGLASGVYIIQAGRGLSAQRMRRYWILKTALVH